MTATPAAGSELLGFLASLIVVISAIVVLGWLYARSKTFGGAGGDVINIVASRSLGSKERLVVVEVAGQQLLVGMTATEVRTLHVLDAPVLDKPSAAATSGFADRMKTALKGIRR